MTVSYFSTLPMRNPLLRILQLVHAEQPNDEIQVVRRGASQSANVVDAGDAKARRDAVPQQRRDYGVSAGHLANLEPW